MKLLGMFVHEEDKEAVALDLTDGKFQFTMLPSESGLSRKDMTTFLLILDEERIDEALAIFEENCEEQVVGAPGTIVEGVELDEQHRVNDGTDPVTVEVGGATGFVVPVERFVKIDSDGIIKDDES